MGQPPKVQDAARSISLGEASFARAPEPASPPTLSTLTAAIATIERGVGRNTKLAELKILTVAKPSQETLFSVCQSAVMEFTEKASTAELQRTAKLLVETQTDEKTKQILDRQRELRKKSCEAVETLNAPPGIDPERLSALAAALAAMSRRERGEFIVDSLGRENLKFDNPGNYARGVEAVMRLTATRADTVAYLRRMQPGILKKMLERQDSSDRALDVVSKSIVVSAPVREQARALRRESAVLDLALRAAIGGALTTLLVAAVERQFSTQIKAHEPGLVQAAAEVKSSGVLARLESNERIVEPQQAIASYLQRAESSAAVEFGQSISRELVLSGLVLLAAAREEQTKKRRDEETRAIVAEEAQRKVRETVIRNLNPTLDALLIEELRQTDFLGPIPFQATPESRIYRARGTAA